MFVDNRPTRLLLKLTNLISSRKQSFKYGDTKRRFVKSFMDPEFPWKQYEGKENPYFTKWGFHFNMIETEYFRRCSGIQADHFIPMSLWNHFIYPFLNRAEWRWAYTDKNMFDRLLGMEEVQRHVDVRLPEAYVKCINSIYFIGEENCTESEAAQYLIANKLTPIFKPSVESNQGKGVCKVECGNATEEELLTLFRSYNGNFVAQECIKQHPALASFNESSVNTIRITTYRDFHGKTKVLYATQRFGGKGSVVDNASAGGGFCSIQMDGTVVRTVHKMHSLKLHKLPDEAVSVIPHFDKIKEAVIYMAGRLPQFAIIGWDVSLTPEGQVVLIEYNLAPGYNVAQECNGPMFSEEDLKDILDRVCKAKLSLVHRLVLKYPNHPGYTWHW